MDYLVGPYLFFPFYTKDILYTNFKILHSIYSYIGYIPRVVEYILATYLIPSSLYLPFPYPNH